MVPWGGRIRRGRCGRSNTQQFRFSGDGEGVGSDSMVRPLTHLSPTRHHEGAMRSTGRQGRDSEVRPRPRHHIMPMRWIPPLENTCFGTCNCRPVAGGRTGQPRIKDGRRWTAGRVDAPPIGKSKKGFNITSDLFCGPECSSVGNVVAVCVEAIHGISGSYQTRKEGVPVTLLGVHPRCEFDSMSFNGSKG